MKVEVGAEASSELDTAAIEARINEVAREYSPADFYVEWDDDRHMVAVRFAAGPLEHRVCRWLPVSTPSREDIERQLLRLRAQFSDSELASLAEELGIELEVVWDAQRQLVCVQTVKGTVLSFHAFDKLKKRIREQTSEHYMLTGPSDCWGIHLREREPLRLAFKWYPVTAEQTEH